MKRKILLSALILTLVCVAAFMLSACSEEGGEQSEYEREVVLELVNPVTSKILAQNDTLDLPVTQTPIKVLITDKETGRWLTDEDLPDTTIEDSVVVLFGNSTGVTESRFWPTNLGHFLTMNSITVYFDCKPEHIEDPEYKRKYKLTSATIKVTLNVVTELNPNKDNIWSKKLCLNGGDSLPVRFVAPQNGIYTFRLRSLDDVKIESTVGTFEGDALKVKLTKYESLNFRVVSPDYNGSGSVVVTAEITPTPIRIGDRKKLSIEPGETEYLAFYSNGDAGFNYTLSKTGDYNVEVLKYDLNTVIFSSSAKTCATNGIMTGDDGKYIIGVTNNTSAAESILLSLSAPEPLSIKEINDLTIEPNGSRLYQVEREMVCGEQFNFNSSSYVEVCFYNYIYGSGQKTSLNLLYSNYDQYFSFNKTLIAGETYYLLIRSPDHLADVRLAIIETPARISDGSSASTNRVYGFEPNVDAKYSVGATNDVNLSVYDRDWQLLSPTDGLYTLSARVEYFIVGRGSASSFVFNASVDYTDDRTVTLDSDGYRFIRFVPDVSDRYTVTSDPPSDYKWYDERLYEHTGYLNAGETYYLKIAGTPGEQYSVNIRRLANQIPINTGLTIGQGLYYFDITEAGEYTLWINSPPTMNVSMSITDSFGNVIIGEQQFENESITISFETGLYYVELKLPNGDKASLRINKS